MKLIFGANGRIGRRVVTGLTELGESVRAFVRNESTARQHFDAQVEIACGDLEDRASIAAAMADVTAVLLCSPVAPNQVALHNAVIDAACQAGQPYVVKISGLATEPGSFVDSGRWHAETETYLQQSGLAFTCLHPYFFMQNLDFQLATAQQEGVLKSAVAHAAIAMVDVRDIAAVAVKLLCNPDLAAGQTLPLTCAAALTYADMAQQMSEMFDRPVEFQTQSLAEVEANLRQAGQADWHVQLLMQFNKAFQQGYGAHPHPAVADLLGRAPLSFVDYLQSVTRSTEGANPFPS